MAREATALRKSRPIKLIMRLLGATLPIAGVEWNHNAERQRQMRIIALASHQKSKRVHSSDVHCRLSRTNTDGTGTAA